MFSAAVYTSAVNATSNTSAPAGASIAQPATNSSRSSAPAVDASAAAATADDTRSQIRLLMSALLELRRPRFRVGARRHGGEVADDEEQQADTEERDDTRQRVAVPQVDEEQLRDDDRHQRGAGEPHGAARRTCA